MRFRGALLNGDELGDHAVRLVRALLRHEHLLRAALNGGVDVGDDAVEAVQEEAVDDPPLPCPIGEGRERSRCAEISWEGLSR
jgi:hypothetical protein